MANFFKYTIITLFIFTCIILFSKNARAQTPVPGTLGLAHIVDGTGSINLNFSGDVWQNQLDALAAALANGDIPNDGSVCLAVIQLGSDGADGDNDNYAEVEIDLVQVFGDTTALQNQITSLGQAVPDGDENFVFTCIACAIDVAAQELQQTPAGCTNLTTRIIDISTDGMPI